MIPLVRSLLIVGIGSLVMSSVYAQDNAGWIEELRQLRKTVEQQSKQIEVLSQQIARLNATLENKAGSPSPAAPAAAAGETAPAGPEEFASPAPGAKSEPGVPKHVILKGETLTSIAKHYNISLADLLKANKDINERKLQIGQSISLPANVQTKNPEPAPTEKANP